MNNKTKIARQLRQDQTIAEEKLWEALRNRKFLDLKFRRQHPLKEYIVDFFCQDYGIIIELDGEYHNELEHKEKDILRDLHLHELGYLVLRFENKVFFEQANVVFNAIEKAKEKQESFFEERRISLDERRKVNEKSLTPTLSQRRGSKITILSTKILSLAQKELVLNSGLGLVEYDAIKIEFLDFKVDKKVDNYIFTSQNGVRAFLKNQNKSPSPLGEGLGERVFCVGSKTKSLLEENGLKVTEMASNSIELGQNIVKNYKKESFLFFCGNRRREELPSILKENKIDFEEVEVYKTSLHKKEFNTVFDGVLFFSPSAVESYQLENKIKESIAFCIGATTAQEAKKHTNTIVIATKTTIENVIVQAVKHFNTNTE